MIDLGKFYFSQQNYPEMIKHYKLAVTRENYEAMYLLASYYAQTFMIDKAKKYFKMLITTKNEYTEVAIDYLILNTNKLTSTKKYYKIGIKHKYFHHLLLLTRYYFDKMSVVKRDSDKYDSLESKIKDLINQFIDNNSHRITQLNEYVDKYTDPKLAFMLFILNLSTDEVNRRYFGIWKTRPF